MQYKIINTCQKYNIIIDHLDYNHKNVPPQDERDILEYFNLELAKAIIQDIGSNNAKHVAKIILGFVE